MIVISKFEHRVARIVFAAGIFAVCGAVYLTDLKRISVTFLVLAVASAVLGGLARIRLSKAGVYLTVSEVLVFLWLVIFGPGIATLIALVEALTAAFLIGRRHKGFSLSTILMNGTVAAVATLTTGVATELVFGGIVFVYSESNSYLVSKLALMFFLQFSLVSVQWAFAVPNRLRRSRWDLWRRHFLNGVALYAVGALGAGIFIRASYGRDVFLVVSGIFMAAVVFFVYRRFSRELTSVHSKAELAEKTRLMEAEEHLKSLEAHIKQLEKAESALRKSEEDLRRQAYHDSLTDLPNRNYLKIEIGKAFERRKETGDYDFALLYIDLNRLRTINESLGQHVADQLVSRIARRLSGMIREEDFLARMPGDEFCIVLNGISNLGIAVHFAELTLKKLSAPFEINEKILFASASIGIALPSSRHDGETLLNDAQTALYRAKSLEKPFVVFDEEMRESARIRHDIETEVRGALSRGEFEAFYQPIVDLTTLRPAGFEALLRWRHPQKGIVPPGEFMTICEDAGFIVPITSWIIEESCWTLASWQQAHGSYDDLFVSVNLSVKDFEREDLIESVKGILKKTGLAPHCLKLEITESAIMENTEVAITQLSQLRRAGIMLSIDDFGTGYSSLSYLHKFPVHTLKADRSFVSTMELGSENGEIVRTVIALAKQLKMKIISEGVETLHQLHQLRVLGSDYGQGYLFSKPVPAEAATEFVQNKEQWQYMSPERMKIPDLPLTDPQVLPTTEAGEILH